MRRRDRPPIEQLRGAIDRLPRETRLAMLEGVRSHDIIVGAYADRRGGVCPMLAAHRCGGRAGFISFARAWDSFTAAGRRARRATERELRVLVAQLEASLLAEEAVRSELAGAIAEHRALVARGASAADADRAPAPARPGDAHRAPELRRRSGWAWLRPFRRLDDYERALARVDAERARAEGDREPELV